MRVACGFLLAALLCSAQPSVPAAERPVVIEKISVAGTRFSLASVQFLSGLKAGQRVNESKVREACEKITNTGLVENVSYSYQSLSAEDSVLLELTITDALPLLPAAIRVDGVNAEDVWKALEQTDALFTRRLPRTEAALAFYAMHIERYLESLGRQVKLTSVVTGDANGNANGIVFVPADTRKPDEFDFLRPSGRRGKR